jgi:hypothetical protein
MFIESKIVGMEVESEVIETELPNIILAETEFVFDDAEIVREPEPSENSGDQASPRFGEELGIESVERSEKSSNQFIQSVRQMKGLGKIALAVITLASISLVFVIGVLINAIVSIDKNTQKPQNDVAVISNSIPEQTPNVEVSQVAIPTSTDSGKSSIEIKTFLGNSSHPLSQDSILKVTDKIHFELTPSNESLLFVVFEEVVNNTIGLYYPRNEFKGSQDKLPGGKPASFPQKGLKPIPIASPELRFGRIFFVFAPDSDDALIKEITGILPVGKDVSLAREDVRSLLEKLDKLAEDSKQKSDYLSSQIVSSTFTSTSETVVGKFEIKIQGK